MLSLHTLTELALEDVALALPGLVFCRCPALRLSARLWEGGSSGEHNMIMMSKLMSKVFLWYNCKQWLMDGTIKVVSQRGKYTILYNRKLSREKTFANFTILWLFVKVFVTKFGGVMSFGMAQASSPQEFP